MQSHVYTTAIVSTDGKPANLSWDSVAILLFVLSTSWQVGETFNPVGYALVLPRTLAFSDHLAFNQVLQYLSEKGDLDSIFDRQLAMPNCASDVGVVSQVYIHLGSVEMQCKL